MKQDLMNQKISLLKECKRDSEHCASQRLLGRFFFSNFCLIEYYQRILHSSKFNGIIFKCSANFWECCQHCTRTNIERKQNYTKNMYDAHRRHPNAKLHFLDFAVLNRVFVQHFWLHLMPSILKKTFKSRFSNSGSLVKFQSFYSNATPNGWRRYVKKKPTTTDGMKLFAANRKQFRMDRSNFFIQFKCILKMLLWNLCRSFCDCITYAI